MTRDKRGQPNQAEAAQCDQPEAFGAHQQRLREDRRGTVRQLSAPFTVMACGADDRIDMVERSLR